MQHMTSHTTTETQLTPLLWALQLQDKHFVLLTGTAALQYVPLYVANTQQCQALALHDQ